MALSRQCYRTCSTLVRIRDSSKEVDSIRWLGYMNAGMLPDADVTPEARWIAPPLLVCDASPLDIVSKLRCLRGQHRPIVLVVELIEFDKFGSANFSSPSAASPRCVQVRTNFTPFAKAAGSQLRSSQATMKDHLCAKHDPYVFFCPGVTVLRGARQEGYPFLVEPHQAHVIGFAMASSRPSVQIVSGGSGQMEWYADEVEHTALLERLNLIGAVALQEAGIDGATVSQTEGMVEDSAGNEGPTLVLGMPGCGERHSTHHPHDAVANSLKHWRRRFGRHFRSVFVCCGGDDPGLARRLDMIVNRQVYRMAVSHECASKIAPWHWNADEINLCVEPARLEQAGRQCMKNNVSAEAAKVVEGVVSGMPTTWKNARVSICRELRKSLQQASLAVRGCSPQDSDESDRGSEKESTHVNSGQGLEAQPDFCACHFLSCGEQKMSHLSLHCSSTGDSESFAPTPKAEVSPDSTTAPSTLPASPCLPQAPPANAEPARGRRRSSLIRLLGVAPGTVDVRLNVAAKLPRDAASPDPTQQRRRSSLHADVGELQDDSSARQRRRSCDIISEMCELSSKGGAFERALPRRKSCELFDRVASQSYADDHELVDLVVELELDRQTPGILAKRRRSSVEATIGDGGVVMNAREVRGHAGKKGLKSALSTGSTGFRDAQAPMWSTKDPNQTQTSLELRRGVRERLIARQALAKTHLAPLSARESTRPTVSPTSQMERREPGERRLSDHIITARPTSKNLEAELSNAPPSQSKFRAGGGRDPNPRCGSTGSFESDSSEESDGTNENSGPACASKAGSGTRDSAHGALSRECSQTASIRSDSMPQGPDSPCASTSPPERLHNHNAAGALPIQAPGLILTGANMASLWGHTEAGPTTAASPRQDSQPGSSRRSAPSIFYVADNVEDSADSRSPRTASPRARGSGTQADGASRRAPRLVNARQAGTASSGSGPGWSPTKARRSLRMTEIGSGARFPALANIDEEGSRGLTNVHVDAAENEDDEHPSCRVRQMSEAEKRATGRRTSHFTALGTRYFHF